MMARLSSFPRPLLRVARLRLQREFDQPPLAGAHLTLSPELLSRFKTCDKLGIRFWDYLGDRLAVAGAKAVPKLLQIVAQIPRPA